MIRQIRGAVLAVEPLGVVLDVSGWGVFVCVSAIESFVLGETVTLYTHLAIKQDGVDLYGFSSKDDLSFFDLLLGVPGVGPKTALSILRRAPRASLIGAIGARDLTYLTRVAGMGKKAAEKLIVELSDKVGTGNAPDKEDTEVFDTLVALGYTEREARKTVGNIPAGIVGKDARLKAALSGATE